VVRSRAAGFREAAYGPSRNVQARQCMLEVGMCSALTAFHQGIAVHSGPAQDADDAVGVGASHPTEEET
jgi:hypothetical protein